MQRTREKRKYVRVSFHPWVRTKLARSETGQSSDFLCDGSPLRLGQEAFGDPENWLTAAG